MGESLIWVPRVVFFPVHLVTEYILRKPMVWTITKIEEHYVIERFVDFLTFFDGDLTLFPRIFLDFGVRPSVGLTLQWQGFIHEDTNLDMGFSFWGDDWIAVGAASTTKVFADDSGRFSMSASFQRRPDLPFFGYGADTEPIERNVKVRSAQGQTFLRAFLAGLNRVSLRLAAKNTRFFSGEGDENPITFSEFEDDADIYTFEAYNWLESELFFEIDTRDPETEFAAGSGFRTELQLSFGFDPGEVDKRNMKYGAELAAFWDISSLHHILAIQAWFQIMERMGGGPLPITELVSMGGPEHMRAFLQNRFLGDSAYEISIRYTWPVWILFDFELFASLGNAFPGRFEGFTWERSYLGWGFGLDSNWSREITISMLFGFGTNRLDSDDVDMEFTRFTLLFKRGF
jgi:hypothetical protein